MQVPIQAGFALGISLWCNAQHRIIKINGICVTHVTVLVHLSYAQCNKCSTKFIFATAFTKLAHMEFEFWDNDAKTDICYNYFSNQNKSQSTVVLLQHTRSWLS